MKHNNILDSLIASGDIASYKYDVVDYTGNVGHKGDDRNTERLVLIFPSGNKLVIDSCCSGCLENVEFFFNVNE